MVAANEGVKGSRAKRDGRKSRGDAHTDTDNSTNPLVVVEECIFFLRLPQSASAAPTTDRYLAGDVMHILQNCSES